MPYQVSSIKGLLAWVAGGIAGGATLVASVAVADPASKSLAEVASVTPDLRTSVVILLMSVFTYLLRRDNQKVTGSAGEALASQQKTLLDRVESLAYETRSGAGEVARETARFRLELAEKVGAISSAVADIRTHQRDMSSKIDKIDTRVSKVETRCEALTSRARQ